MKNCRVMKWRRCELAILNLRVMSFMTSCNARLKKLWDTEALSSASPNFTVLGAHAAHSIFLSGELIWKLLPFLLLLQQQSSSARDNVTISSNVSLQAHPTVPNTTFNIYDWNKHHDYWFILFPVAFPTPAQLSAFFIHSAFTESAVLAAREKSILLATQKRKYAPGLHGIFFSLHLIALLSM